MGCQWHQLNHMQVISTSLHTDYHDSTSSLKFFTGQMLFLPPNQQHQSTEGTMKNCKSSLKHQTIKVHQHQQQSQIRRNLIQSKACLLMTVTQIIRADPRLYPSLSTNYSGTVCTVNILTVSHCRSLTLIVISNFISILDNCCIAAHSTLAFNIVTQLVMCTADALVS